MAWHKRMLHGPRGVTAWGRGARGPAAAAGRCPRSPGLSPLWRWDGSSLPGSLQHLLRRAPKLVVPNSPSVMECCICSPCPALPAREPQNPSLQAPSAALPAGAPICSFLGARDKVPSPGVVAKREVCFWLLQCGERLLAVSCDSVQCELNFLSFLKSRCFGATLFYFVGPAPCSDGRAVGVGVLLGDFAHPSPTLHPGVSPRSCPHAQRPREAPRSQIPP